MYAIIKTGGKQYRVEEGETLLVERLPVEEGADVALPPLLYVDGDDVLDGDALARVTVQATVVAHERGPKLRIVKFKPKRGYKRRTGHRQELTRIRVSAIVKSAKADSIASSAGGGVGVPADSIELAATPSSEEIADGS
jgi:large subunit ribosomal protein L21